MEALEALLSSGRAACPGMRGVGRLRNLTSNQPHSHHMRARRDGSLDDNTSASQGIGHEALVRLTHRYIFWKRECTSASTT